MTHIYIYVAQGEDELRRCGLYISTENDLFLFCFSGEPIWEYRVIHESIDSYG